MIKCIAIDDEPLSLKIISILSEKVDYIQLMATFTNINEATEYLQNHEIDLLFLDIQMPDINGLEFYKKIGEDKMVVFTTAYSSYAHEGFNVSAIDFLLKPFDQDRFMIACERVKDTMIRKSPALNDKLSFISVKADYKTLLIQHNDILYIESKDDYVKIFLTNGKFVMSKMTTKMMADKLEGFSFERIHRSYIVNKLYVQQVKSSTLLVQQNELPIGKNFKQTIKEMFKV